jgi:hypothetical protein
MPQVSISRTSIKPEGKNMKCELTIMTDLDARMLAKNATAAELSRRSGVSVEWIGFARKGKPVRVEFAGFVAQALDKYEFRYKYNFTRGLPGRDYGPKRCYVQSKAVSCPKCSREYIARGCFECVACSHGWNEGDEKAYKKILAERAMFYGNGRTETPQ